MLFILRKCIVNFLLSSKKNFYFDSFWSSRLTFQTLLVNYHFLSRFIFRNYTWDKSCVYFIPGCLLGDIFFPKLLLCVQLELEQEIFFSFNKSLLIYLPNPIMIYEIARRNSILTPLSHRSLWAVKVYFIWFDYNYRHLAVLQHMIHWRVINLFSWST